MAKLTESGLKKYRNMVLKMAVRDDEEVNAILQEAIVKLNRLRVERYGDNSIPF